MRQGSLHSPSGKEESPFELKSRTVSGRHRSTDGGTEASDIFGTFKTPEDAAAATSLAMRDSGSRDAGSMARVSYTVHSFHNTEATLTSLTRKH